jgi:hypothetical protein
LWRAVRRGLLTICAAIERDSSAHPLWVAVRQGLLLIADAIETELKAGGLS